MSNLILLNIDNSVKVKPIVKHVEQLLNHRVVIIPPRENANSIDAPVMDDFETSISENPKAIPSNRINTTLNDLVIIPDNNLPESNINNEIDVVTKRYSYH